MNDNDNIIRESEESGRSSSDSEASDSNSESSNASKGSRKGKRASKKKLEVNSKNLKSNEDEEEHKASASALKNKHSPLKVKGSLVDDEEGQEEEDDNFKEAVDTKQAKGGPFKDIDRMEAYQDMEENIIRHCRENNCLWSDDSFPADNRSLYREPLKIPEWAKEVKTIKWLRPNEIVKDAKFMVGKDGDVKQGAFGESWFVGALVIVSTKGDFLEKLFVDIEHFDLGFVSFQFFKNGEWRQIIVDTVLPFDPDSKQIVYAQCANPTEFWVPLMEKAYSKMHGCYENIVEFNMVEGLVDLTGGVSEGWTLNDPDTQKQIENNTLWSMMNNYFHQKFYIGCVNQVEGKSAKNADNGPHGILENHCYGVLDIREFPKEGLKLIKIRNVWGPDGGWSGPFSDDSEEWDKHRNLRDELNLVFKSKKADGTWWMAYSDWCVHFNKMFVCKVFPETWQMYSIPSKWQGKTAGGVCPPKMEYEGPHPQPEHLQMDSDDRWFNNPQFRIKVEKETKIYISLMQEDEKLSRVNYIRCNFMVIANRSPKNRIWERPPQPDIISEWIRTKETEVLPVREITMMVTLKKFEGKNYGYYIVVPNTITDNKKEEQRPFWFRLFASEMIEVVEMPETLELSLDGQWTDDNSGGKRKIDSKENPSWCKNPQYFLNLKVPTHLKIILKKTGNIKKNRNVRVGMTICRYDTQTKQKGPQVVQKKPNAAGVSNLQRLMAQTAGHLEPPTMDTIERKLQIITGEKFKESSYSSDEVASLFFKWNPTEGPFIVIPSLDQEYKLSSYRLTIFSNNPVELKKLEETKNAVLIGKWEPDISDGGCHLYEEPYEKEMNKRTWTMNPRFIVQFKEYSGAANLKVTLAIAEKNWKAKTKNAVGGMIGVYILEARENAKMNISHLKNDPKFMPLTVASEECHLSEISKIGYYIMPTTYESKISGTFIISVSSDREFTMAKM